MLASSDVIQEVPVFGAWVPLCCLEPILLLEQGVGGAELVPRKKLRKQASVVKAVANSMSTKDSLPQFKVSSRSCIEVHFQPAELMRTHFWDSVKRVVLV